MILKIKKITRHWWCPFITKYIEIEIAGQRHYIQRFAVGDILEIKDNKIKFLN